MPTITGKLFTKKGLEQRNRIKQIFKNFDWVVKNEKTQIVLNDNMYIFPTLKLFNKKTSNQPDGYVLMFEDTPQKNDIIFLKNLLEKEKNSLIVLTNGTLFINYIDGEFVDISIFPKKFDQIDEYRGAFIWAFDGESDNNYKSDERKNNFSETPDTILKASNVILETTNAEAQSLNQLLNLLLNSDNLDKDRERMIELAKKSQSYNAKANKYCQKLQEYYDKLLTSYNEIKIIYDENEELKKENLELEKTIEKLSNKIDNLLSNLSIDPDIEKSCLKDYSKFWNLLEENSKKYILTSKTLENLVKISKIEDVAPIILEKCRVLENELLSKIFKKFEKYLKDYNTPKTHDEKYLAGKLKKYKSPPKSYFTMGRMVFMLNPSVFYKNYDYTNFRTFLNNLGWKDEIFSDDFVKECENYKNNYRNKAAHTNAAFHESELNECERLTKFLLTQFYSFFTKSKR